MSIRYAAAFICVLSQVSHAGDLSKSFEEASAIVKSDRSRQELVWSVEERIVGATLDELMSGRLELMRSFVDTASRHQGRLGLGEGQLAAAAEAVRSAENARLPLVQAGVLAADPSGRLVFVHYGKAPAPQAVAAYQQFLAAIEASSDDPGYAAVVDASRQYGECGALGGEAFALCNELRRARVAFEVRFTRFRIAMDGDLFSGSSGLRASLARAIEANGGAFNSRWRQPSSH